MLRLNPIPYNNKETKGGPLLTKTQGDKQLNQIIFGISLFVVFPVIMFLSVFQLIVRVFLLSEIPPHVTETGLIFYLGLSILYLVSGAASILFLFRSKVQLIFPGVLFAAGSAMWIYATYNTTSTYNLLDTLGMLTNLILLIIAVIKFVNLYKKQ